MKFSFWVGRRYYIVNVVDDVTNNEYGNLEILVEEEFSAEEFQIIRENKMQVVIMSLARNTTDDDNVDWWANKKATKLTTCKTFYLFVRSVGSLTENRSFMKFT